MICWRSGRRFGRVATSRPGCWRILQEAALQAGWLGGEYEAWRGRRVKTRSKRCVFPSRPRRRRDGRARRSGRSFGRLPRAQPLPDRAPHRQRRLRRRLRGLGRPPRAAGRGQGDRAAAARPAGGCCARPRRRRGSTTPASSPSTRWARRTATPCWSPSWSRARPWPASPAPASSRDREIGEIGADLCEALDHAHSRGVVHRDIKPQNVQVTETDGEPRAKLMDFGIARLADGAGADRARRRRRHPRLHVARAGRGPRRRPRGRRLLAGPDALRVLERREPAPARQPGRDRARDRRPHPAAAPPAPRPAARADRRDRRLPRRRAPATAPRWRSWAPRSRTRSTSSPTSPRSAHRHARRRGSAPLAARRRARRLARARPRRPL